jgi:FkbM family methyltransferase
MDEVFEMVVAENRRLRQELKALNARVAAFESSRWWRLHPRFVLNRFRSQGSSENGAERGGPEVITAKVARVARQWRLKAAYEELNSGTGPDEIVLREGLRLRVHPESRYSFEEFSYGSPEMVDELDAFIAATGEKQRLLDVGALHGVFSLVFAAGKPDKTALAVDASPIPFAKLLYNIRKNGADNITATECALSDRSGFLEMHYDWEHAVAGAAAGEESTFRVASRTGDDLCTEHSFAPDVVKIDVEGHELRVLQGLRATLGRDRPLIFLEVHPEMIRANPENGGLAELAGELRELGYPRVDLRGSTVPVEALTEFIEIERVVLRPEGG